MAQLNCSGRFGDQQSEKLKKIQCEDRTIFCDTHVLKEEEVRWLQKYAGVRTQYPDRAERHVKEAQSGLWGKGGGKDGCKGHTSLQELTK